VAERPLAGRRIVVTRPREQAEELADALEELGAEVSVVPLISIDPIEDVDQLKDSMRGLHHVDWLVVTSTNAVRALVTWPGLEWVVRNARVAAVGPATAAALRRTGVEADFVPEEYAAENIAGGLGELTGARVLLTQSDIADSGLADALRERGAVVQPLHVYRTTEVEPAAPDVEVLAAAAAVILMSGSAARSLAAAGGAGDALLVCVGPKTAAAVAEVGLDVGLVADEATADGIIRVLVAYFGEST
jgi:uroporphyrinogen III methyltransferase / synthase